MAQILQNKKLATRFQILAEIAASQPNIQQKSIAQRTNITPQAVSDYVAQLVEEGFIINHGKSRYTITNEGVDWILKMVREIKEYSSFVERAITNTCVCTAVAEHELSQGQKVELKMHDGILWASAGTDGKAHGIATSDVVAGDDVGVSNIEGIVELTIGRITIVKVPDINRGGSSQVDLSRLKSSIPKGIWMGAIGLEAVSALRKIKREPQYLYGVEEATVEAAYSGLSPFVVCVADRIPGLIQRLQKENLEYLIIDLTINKT